MSKCISCSAPLPPNAIVCEYCGTRNDTDLAGIHTYTTHELESARTCPRCNLAMKTIDLKLNGKFYIERCQQCMGLFFDPGELEVLLKASVKNVFHINRKKLDRINATMAKKSPSVNYVKCPECHKIMNRMNFGSRSGVIVDRCTEHGVWLDGGELRHLFEWMKAGGEILDQEAREKQIRKKEKEQMATTKKDAPLHTGGLHIYDNEFAPGDTDLFQVVQGVVRWFMK
ncbi:Transcription factor zinc-finger [Desulfocicer vacuolatum DSM 3385]|uniref:Transcription factor zinc-finger n=1 Tax=Desulfocicer vacuolatum DSM 3385 TaxID=1121400 RepID=A0A1W2A2X8_9BACT|nr:zf-TFIIB domain-containing protein [Desulfocicer vacuolatum]SMC55000.1 Transcription factor zinc-finger [Desulfocicer vacuolatum DSM 3385]